MRLTLWWAAGYIATLGAHLFADKASLADSLLTSTGTLIFAVPFGIVIWWPELRGREPNEKGRSSSDDSRDHTS